MPPCIENNMLPHVPHPACHVVCPVPCHMSHVLMYCLQSWLLVSKLKLVHQTLSENEEDQPPAPLISSVLWNLCASSFSSYLRTPRLTKLNTPLMRMQPGTLRWLQEHVQGTGKGGECQLEDCLCNCPPTLEVTDDVCNSAPDLDSTIYTCTLPCELPFTKEHIKKLKAQIIKEIAKEPQIQDKVTDDHLSVEIVANNTFRVSVENIYLPSADEQEAMIRALKSADTTEENQNRFAITVDKWSQCHCVDKLRMSSFLVAQIDQLKDQINKEIANQPKIRDAVKDDNVSVMRVGNNFQVSITGDHLDADQQEAVMKALKSADATKENGNQFAVKVDSWSLCYCIDKRPLKAQINQLKERINEEIANQPKIKDVVKDQNVIIRRIGNNFQVSITGDYLDSDQQKAVMEALQFAGGYTPRHLAPEDEEQFSVRAGKWPLCYYVDKRALGLWSGTWQVLACSPCQPSTPLIVVTVCHLQGKDTGHDCCPPKRFWLMCASSILCGLLYGAIILLWRAPIFGRDPKDWHWMPRLTVLGADPKDKTFEKFVIVWLWSTSTTPDDPPPDRAHTHLRMSSLSTRLMPVKLDSKISRITLTPLPMPIVCPACDQLCLAKLIRLPAEDSPLLRCPYVTSKQQRR